jgi:predicted amidohydrolase
LQKMNPAKFDRLHSGVVPKPPKAIASVHGMALLFLLMLAIPMVRAQTTGATPAKAFLFKVALLQISPAGANVSSNLSKAEEFCRRAAEQGADLALMPEMWSIGYTGYKRDDPGAREAFYSRALQTDSPPIRRFSTLAKELNMAIGLTYLQAFAPAPRNVITLFDRHGREIFTYAKIHTCDFRAMEAALTPGDMFCVGTLETKAGTLQVGAMVCFDREFPESARILMLKGAEIVLTPNASMLKELHLDQFKIRAWENTVGVAMANYPSPLHNGHSVAYDAAGHCLVEGGETEGLFMATFDINQLRELRSKSIWGNAYRRPHRYQLLTAPGQEEIWRRRDGSGAMFEPPKR